MSSEAQRRATAKYDKANKVTVTVKLNRKHDADIIEHLAKQENKQGYIKSLIRQAMKGE